MSVIVENRPLYQAAPDIDSDEIELADLLAVLFERKKLIFGSMIVGLVLGIAYLFLATPIYKADALIQIEEKQSGLGGLDINELFEGDTSISAEIEIIKSRMVLGAVVENLSLEVHSEADNFPIVGAAIARRFENDTRNSIRVESLDVSPDMVGKQFTLVVQSGRNYRLLSPKGDLLLVGEVGELAAKSIGGGQISMFVSELRAKKGDTFSLKKRSKLRTIESLQKALKITEKGKGSGILSISLHGADAAAVRQQVNEVANVYVRQNVERKSAEAEKTLSFLEKQLPIVRKEMEAAEVALNTYRLEKGSVDLPLETQAILETIVSVEGQLNAMRQERDKVTQAYTQAHPTVIALDKQISRMAGELRELNDKVRELPNTQQEILRLVRDTEVNTSLYTSLLNTAQELRVVRAGTVGNARIVDYAVQPYKRVKPIKAVVLPLSLVLGVFAGLAVAFLQRGLSSGVVDPDLIEKKVNIPVYASISHSKRQQRLSKKVRNKEIASDVLAVDSPDDIAIESLRNLKTALHFGMMDARNSCIMIAGPSPTVGKSFVSINLAAVLADNEKKILLIDGDMRRGQLHESLGLTRENGLSDFICGDIPIGKALHATAVPGLTLIPTGKIPPNPAELLLHKRFANCLSVLAPRFDHIVIDSPPVLAVTDATIIGQMAGATLLVLKSGTHPIREIEQTVKRLRVADVNLRGVLINDVALHAHRYGQGKYNYHYSYN